MFELLLHHSIPSYITGAQYPVFGSLYDPIGPSIAAHTAGVAFHSPGTWAAASAVGQEQAHWITMALQSSSSFGPSAYSFVGDLSGVVQWAGSGFLW